MLTLRQLNRYVVAYINREYRNNDTARRLIHNEWGKVYDRFRIDYSPDEGVVDDGYSYTNWDELAFLCAKYGCLVEYCGYGYLEPRDEWNIQLPKTQDEYLMNRKDGIEQWKEYTR